MDTYRHAPLAPTALMLGNFVTGMSVLAPAGMLIELSSDLNVSVRNAGLLITFGAIVLGVGSPLTAWLTSRIERWRLLVVTLAVMTLTNAASAFATDFDMLMAIRLVMLAVGVIFTPQAAGVAGFIAPPEKRASTISYLFLGWSLATAIGLPLVTLAASQFGWRTAYAGIAALGLVSTLMLAWRLPRGLAGTPVDLATWIALARSKLVLLLLAGTMLQIAGQFVIFTFMGPLLLLLTGASPQAIGFVFAAYGIGGFVGNIIATRIVDGWGAYRTSLLFTGCLFVGASIWALGAGFFAVMATGVAVWGLGFAATNSMQQARLVGAAPTAPSAAVSLNTSSLYLGQAIGSAVGGALFGRELYAAMGFVAAGLIGLALFAVLATRRFSRADA
jgi:predicted MFS family arabinose efflux permease